MDDQSKTTLLKERNLSSNEEDEDGDDVMASYQKYESPKFFVGSGSPVRKQSLEDDDHLEEDGRRENDSDGNEAHSRRDRRLLTSANDQEDS